MAALTFVGSSPSSLTFYCSGLEHTWGTNNGYEQFYIVVSGGPGAGTSSPVYPPPSSSNNFTPSVTKSGLSPSTTYTVTGYVVFDGSTINVGSGNYSTDPDGGGGGPDTTYPYMHFDGFDQGADYIIAYFTATDNVAISTVQFTLNGSYYGSQPGGSGSQYFGGLTPNTMYTIRGTAYDTSGLFAWEEWYVYTDGYPRPSNYFWSSAKVQGADCYVGADEWNSLKSTVNFMEDYVYGSHTTFFFVFSGDTFLASEFNLVRNVVASMGPPISPPSTVSSGGDVTASALNLLVSSLNSIP